MGYNPKGNEFQHMMKNIAIKYSQEFKKITTNPNEIFLELMGTELLRKKVLGVHLPFMNERVDPVYVKRQIVKSLDGMAELFSTHGLTKTKEYAEQIIPYLVGQKSTDRWDFDLCLGEVPNGRFGRNYSIYWAYANVQDKFNMMNNKRYY